ncbi:hypothetical protein RIVM261_044450 [Rivularia sp. IAM M-261]|nr:hypothetical protein CAL7716_086050 [Calothrix sp. PCC 7716]GJD19489.1 hypothetical protein RIVM261_044450 [Rivularia sp. IAM M-261]
MSIINRCRLLSAAFIITYIVATPARAGVIQNTATYKFKTPTGEEISAETNQLKQELIDPFGRIRGCGGEILPDYAGFSVGLYEAGANDTLNGLVSLTRTGLGTNFTGLRPNIQNANPYFLANEEPKGAFNYLLNRNNGQLDIGRRYILVVNPPPGARGFSQRQIRIIITARDDVAKTVSYTATALDGKGISQDGDPASFSTTVAIQDGTTTGLVLSAISLLDRPICVGVTQPIQIVKTGDRAAAEPGDTVIYRLLVRNLNNVPSRQVSVTDVLPTGFRFVANSARAELNGQSITVDTNNQGSNLTFNLNQTIPPEGSINLVYAVKITPDAVRGSGENLASVTARRQDNNAELKDGPSRYRLRIRNGIITDCGTLIGRVFYDKNFDGEQQTGEPGIPNAVVILDDGNRITTDVKGLFSVANVISGSRTGVLDLTSVPGYDVARNRKFKERRSQSRLVRLEPGGLARMNFGVTPVEKIGDKSSKEVQP